MGNLIALLLDEAIQNGAKVLTGNRSGRGKLIVADAADDPIFRGPADCAGVPLEGCDVLKRTGESVVVLVGKPGQDCDKHGARHVHVRRKFGFADAVHPALLMHVVHGGLVPGRVGNVLEGRRLDRDQEHGKRHNESKHQRSQTSELVFHFTFPFRT